jgi:hypothetical protein
MSEQQPALNSLNEAIEAFQRMTVPQGPSNAGVLAHLGDRESTTARPVTSPSPSTWRRYLLGLLVPSAAAALLVAGLVGWLLLSSRASVALADVVKATEKHKLVRYREQITKYKDNSDARHESIVHADLRAPRLRSESLLASSASEAVFLSVHDGRLHLTTNSRQKTARLDPAPKGYKSVLCCLEEFEQKKGVVQGPDKLGELKVVKYHLEEDMQTTTLWVDARTKLPLRWEQVFFGSPADSPRLLVWTDFAWDPELPKRFQSLDELFSTRPPDGYTLQHRPGEKKGTGERGK